jgi:hypothetical protein
VLSDPEAFRKRLTNIEEMDVFCQVGPTSCSRDEPPGTKDKNIHIAVDCIESVNIIVSVGTLVVT